jgi:Tol biopolymer transport system component
MHRTHFKPLYAVLASALILSACAQRDSASGLQLPSSFRLAPNDSSLTFFEQRSGKIAVTRSDGNIFVTDQTGQNPIMVTRDADFKLDRRDPGIIELGYVLPVWSPDASRLLVLENITHFPMTLTTEIEGIEGALVKPNIGGTVQEQLIGRPTSREVTATEALRFDNASRIVINHSGSYLSTSLYTVVPDGKSALKELLHTELPFIDFADWSPQGDQLGVVSRGQDGRTLSIVNTESGRSFDVTTGYDVNWSWHPDGSTVLAQTRLARETPRSELAVYATDNGEQISNVVSKAMIGNGSSRFSPDGQFMVFSQPGEKAGSFDLVLADRDGKLLRKLTGFDGSASYVWSPTGASLAFVVRPSSKNPAGPLSLLDVNSGQVRLLSANPVLGFFWSPDGARIAAFGPVLQTSIPTDSQAINFLPERAQAPMLVQMIDAGTGISRPIMYTELSQVFTRVLLLSDVYASVMTIWSPNSRRFLLPMKFTPQRGASAVNIIVETEATGSIFPREIANGAMATWSPR